MVPSKSTDGVQGKEKLEAGSSKKLVKRRSGDAGGSSLFHLFTGSQVSLQSLALRLLPPSHSFSDSKLEEVRQFIGSID